MRPNPLPQLEVSQHVLDNGLVVLLHREPSVPLVAVNVNYRVGSKDERPGRTGFAHLFEHMMFEGSKHWPRDYFEALIEVGGEVNGATSTDRTRYWELLPSSHLERALWLEADRMGFLLDALTSDRLATQIAVVQNERRQSYENRPYGTVRERMLAVLYPPDHPYHWPTIGFMADIAAATLDDVTAFFRTYYRPSNASICIAGDFEPDAALGMVEKHFGALPPGGPIARVARRVPRLAADVELAIEDRVQLPRAYLAWHTVPLFDAEDAALDAFARILGGSRTSRLYRRLVHDRELAQEALAYHSSSEVAGSFGVVLTPRPERSLAEVEAAADAVLHELLEDGPTEEEVERVRTSATAHVVRSLQEIGRFGGRSDRLNEYLHHLGVADAYRYDLQRTLDLEPAAVLAAGRAHLSGARLTARVTPFPPRAASTSAAATSVDRTVVPAARPAREPRLPRRDRFRLDGGLEAVLVEHHALPLATVAVALRTGSAADPAGLEGLASLTTSLLQEGAAGRSSALIAEALESLGAELSLSTASDAVLLRVTALRERLAEAVALLAEIALAPDFSAAEFERLRRRRLVQLVQLSDQPTWLAQRVFASTLFGGHPYAESGIGTRASLAALGRDDVVGCWRHSASPPNMAVLAAGDLTRADLESVAAPFAAWRSEAGPESVAPPAPAPPPAAIHLLDRPSAPQSVIVAGHLGPARSSPDVPALALANAVLGGMFVSRLNLNLRERRGFTYGARSRFEFARHGGTFSVTTSVDEGATAEAVAEIAAEVTAFAGPRPPRPDELDKARALLVDGVARRFETQGQLLHSLLDLVTYGLPDDEWERELEAFRSATAETVAATAARTLEPRRLVFVVVGDAARLSPKLEALGLAPVVATGAIE